MITGVETLLDDTTEICSNGWSLTGICTCRRGP